MATCTHPWFVEGRDGEPLAHTLVRAWGGNGRMRKGRAGASVPGVQAPELLSEQQDLIQNRSVEKPKIGCSLFLFKKRF